MCCCGRVASASRPTRNEAEAIEMCLSPDVSRGPHFAGSASQECARASLRLALTVVFD